ncbi:alpha/beta hydrolase family protein [Martelella limonii]|uniref:alpha/beta hydrolase family protein n=1 Tax=Martelella limonii TaxID=1647649 RepID=UPI0015807DBE|nr:hypothetical protein [Martelella limonii]
MLSRDGLDPKAIDLTIVDQSLEDEHIFGPEAAGPPAGMSADRWQFIRLDREADARDAIARLDLPVLAIWGADDLNVNPVRNAANFRDALTGREKETEIIIWPEAAHGLLKASAYIGN